MSDDVTTTDEQFLRRALALAAEAGERGDHPFGAVLVSAGDIIFEARNTVNSSDDPCAHAELNLVRMAQRALGEGQLVGMTLYSSAEPCMMCSGALFISGVSRVVYSVPASGLAAATGWPFACACREVFAAGRVKIDVHGPLLADDGAAVLRRFWG